MYYKFWISCSSFVKRNKKGIGTRNPFLFEVWNLNVDSVHFLARNFNEEYDPLLEELAHHC